MYNLLIIILFLKFTTLYGCDCVSNQPVITNDFYVQEGSLCPSCNYFYKYPNGFHYISFQFSYTDIIYLKIYQNNILIHSYNNTMCFNRFDINELYSTEILIYTNSNKLVWGLSQHMITFSNKNNSISLPNLNTIYSSIISFSKERNYKFAIPYTTNLYVAMKFNNTINLNILCDNLIIINVNNMYIEDTFNFSNYKCNLIYIVIFSFVDTNSVKLVAIPKIENFISYTLNNNKKVYEIKEETIYIEDTVHKKITITFICATVCYGIILICMVCNFCSNLRKKNINTDYEMVEINTNTNSIV